MQKALDFRSYLDFKVTNSYRLFNGEGDKLPGLVCDVYADTAVIQLDGQGAFDFWPKDDIANWLLQHLPIKTVIARSREDKANFLSWGDPAPTDVIVLENSVKFKVNIIKGQKTGFFLDQRENREYIKTHAKNKRVLNLFSYTGGFSMFAGIGGASHVTSVDVAKDALDYAQDNWNLNNLPDGKHDIKKEDAFEFIKNTQEKWDMIIVDPPSMAHSERDKYKAMTKYTEVFADSAKRLNSGGSLILSSCSSHISFEDFFSMIEEALSKARTSGQVFRVTGQAADHPFLHVGRELRYLKFFHLIL
ncbi:MAG: class I SAM-dependent rRNA methyltransferase, partial [Bdellovibrionales bacterium]|nr:class I SAM-dependent rRNA methyltransferase [Bdellovibrionales bacterium]